MEGKTNKELLEIILQHTRDNAKKQFEFACEVSNFMNEQNRFNTEQILINNQIRGYLENNTQTNQRGIVEQVRNNTKDIEDIKTEKKIEKRTIAVISATIGSAITYLSKFLF